jgi:membrane protein YqaA with SNARE-associated domain
MVDVRNINHAEITVPALFVVGFVFLILVVGVNEFTQAFTITEVAKTADMFIENSFVKLGIFSIFLYELIPSAFRLLGTTGFFIGLINEGIHPMLLIVLASLGRLLGWYILYLIGKLVYRVFKGKERDLAGADHFLHKYRLIVFFLVPFLGALGDLVVVIAGHQRIGFIRMLPFLLFGNIIRYSIWLYITLGQLNLFE